MLHSTSCSTTNSLDNEPVTTRERSRESATQADLLHAIPTLISGGSADPGGLIAALAFMEAVSTRQMTAPDLRRWFDQFLVKTGCMPRPTSVYERSTGRVTLDDDSLETSTTLARAVIDARAHVAWTLRGLVLDKQDDQFLLTMATAGRVAPISNRPRRRWVPRPHGSDSLSEIVLSIFAADILSNRAMYDENLCVCDLCGRVGFHAKRAVRTRCRDHLTQAAHGQLT